MPLKIQIAETDQQIDACYPVMQELRDHLKKETFVTRVRYQQSSGYLLAFLKDDGIVAAVSGFRIGENLAWGRFLYIDDLVTAQRYRSHGYGSRLLAWLKDYAKQQQCDQLHLDSGLQRVDAHRFYLREGLPKTSFHFSTTI
ncbi:MAG: GNAT family N-acetyltransferase [Pseudomonadales bacterium]|nr:GNAT family N-acetyltransferase [Pseudomonadales bacterium]